MVDIKIAVQAISIVVAVFGGGALLLLYLAFSVNAWYDIINWNFSRSVALDFLLAVSNVVLITFAFIWAWR